MELTEFVSARLDEGEAWAVTAECLCEDGEPQKPDCPARVLATVEAHRKIVAEAREIVDDPEKDWGDVDSLDDHHVQAFAFTFRALASIWADHPDFDPAWEA